MHRLAHAERGRVFADPTELFLNRSYKAVREAQIAEVLLRESQLSIQ